MTDQADTLRRLMQQRARNDERGEEPRSQPRVFTFASGKGGVGKTFLTANLGAALARSGLRVLLVDGDSGLANLDIMLGLPSEGRATFEQVLDGEASLQDAIVGVEPNLWLIPAGAGLSDLREGAPEDRVRLMEALESSPWEMDVILVDVGAGIQHNVLSLHSGAFESLVVLTPDPASMTDAYGLIKLLARHASVDRVGVIVNHVTDGRHAQILCDKLKDVTARFSGSKIEYVGHCIRDEKITQSVLKRKILLDLFEGTPSVACLELLAKRISEKAQDYQRDRADRRRFQEETSWVPGSALRASQQGNTARFWRTLLGEVKT